MKTIKRKALEIDGFKFPMFAVLNVLSYILLEEYKLHPKEVSKLLGYKSDKAPLYHRNKMPIYIATIDQYQKIYNALKKDNEINLILKDVKYYYTNKK